MLSMTRFLVVLPLLLLAACRPSGDAPEAEGAGLDLPAGRYPSVAADTVSGAVYAAWIETAGVGARVRLGRLADGALEGEPITLAEGAIGVHSQAAPLVAVGPEGTVYVVWVVEREVEGRRFAASDLVLARSTDGGRTFSEPRPVHPDPGFPTGHTFHSLAVGFDGTVYVAWLDGTAKDRYRLDHPRAPMGHGEEPDPHHAHAEADEPGTEVVVARSADGGQTFEPPVVVAHDACPCCRTSLDVAPDGAVGLAWRHHYDGDLRDMTFARSTDGGRTFSAPVRIHEDGWALDGCPHAGPAVTTAGDGTIHVVWFTGAPDSTGVRHAVSADGGRSFETGFLQRDTPLAQVRAIRDGAGRPWLAWEDPEAGVIRIARADGEARPLERSGADPSLTPTRDGWMLATAEADRLRLHHLTNTE